MSCQLHSPCQVDNGKKTEAELVAVIQPIVSARCGSQLVLVLIAASLLSSSFCLFNLWNMHEP